ncbi:MAG: glutamine-hydrolyzing GMP synthase [Lachnospiraceae bacterium]|nr:glutamine-hydrolyzing GMP synthase [Lachnospiraceae bacterium]
MEKVLFINGMGCEKCEARVKSALEAVSGVKKVYVSRIAKQAVVQASESVSDEALVNAVAALEHYPVEGILLGDLRPEKMARIENRELAETFIEAQVDLLKKQIGDGKVLLALSGGVDSSVCAALLLRAVGDQLTCIHVNHGLMRKGESELVLKVFRDEFNANIIFIDAVDRFLDKLAGVSDPEQKRKIIGGEFIKVFDEESAKLSGIGFLGQGTIYPDILESKDGIKAHHNVGGLPEEVKMELVEPLKLLYKDEVRQVGSALGLPDTMVNRQPFPGPGLGVRCVGAITRDRLEAVRESDAILREEFAHAGLDKKVWQYFTVVPPFKATGIKNGKRAFEWICIIRAVNTRDAVTATIEELDYSFLKKVAERITHEVPGITRVLYDVTGKPTATIEYE